MIAVDFHRCAFSSSKVNEFLGGSTFAELFRNGFSRTDLLGLFSVLAAIVSFVTLCERRQGHASISARTENVPQRAALRRNCVLSHPPSREHLAGNETRIG